MNKKRKNLINNFVWPVISIGSLVIAYFLTIKLKNFIPYLDFCSSDYKSLCDIALLGKILSLANTGVLTGLIIWFSLMGVALLILNKLGFKFKDLDTSY
jgi:hypothetical protein